MTLYQTLIDDDGTPVKQPRPRLVQWGPDKIDHQILNQSMDNMHQSPPPPAAGQGRHHSQSFAQQAPAQPRSDLFAQQVPRDSSSSSSLAAFAGTNSGGNLPGTRVGTGSIGEIYVSAADEVSGATALTTRRPCRFQLTLMHVPPGGGGDCVRGDERGNHVVSQGAEE